MKGCDTNGEHQLSEKHSTAESASDLDCDNLIEAEAENENLQDTIIKKFASVLRKLETLSHVTRSAIDELLEELHFIFTSAAVPVSHSTAFDIFNKHNLQVNLLIINELILAISINNPLVIAIAKGGPLASAFKCKQYYKENFKVVEPVEYVRKPRTAMDFFFYYLVITTY